MSESGTDLSEISPGIIHSSSVPHSSASSEIHPHRSALYQQPGPGHHVFHRDGCDRPLIRALDSFSLPYPLFPTEPLE